jgi:hydrogenase-4 component F
MTSFLALLPFQPVHGVIAVPAVAAILLALLPGRRGSATLNVAASFLTFLLATTLLIERPPAGEYLFVDDLNVVFVVLGTFVGFTTSVFSASYIAHEIDAGKLSPGQLRFYHGMYQALAFAMNLGLLDRKSTRLNSSHNSESRMPSSA